MLNFKRLDLLLSLNPYDAWTFTGPEIPRRSGFESIRVLC